MSALTYYIFGLSVVTLFISGYDKAMAQKGGWRVSERTLWILAILGGSPGLLLSMNLFRHKTRKASFHFWLALILLVQVVLVSFWMR